uniref:NADH-ubiquinone oxidoreductase chain 1 n=1 Tax=Trigonidium sjostedti TaxID=1914573 RepID=A0A1J0M4I4_9ORTH|nr:NADH dehydrogenase subunit 1 [Trigonidium sjostedti]APD14953.1 NADH dehydrogenase subunit 1 [Trigonidium sjostedti]
MYLSDLFLGFISYLILMICVLVSVAFLTLLERKILGYIQIRKGPNKLGYMGILQPFSDAIKLFCKEMTYPIMSNYLLYFICPILSLFLSLSIWLMFPFVSNLITMNLGILYFFCLSSISVYSIMLAGWSSNSNYALLGSLRSVAQTISYEVSLAMILLSLVILIESFNMINFYMYQEKIWFMFLALPLFFCWFSSCLAETNRTPFDFAEGESELVSGFNVEYSSGGFALIFMAEYGSILFMSMLSVMVFMGGDFFTMIFYFKLVIISFLFVWVRGTFPRFRYDKLMYLTWKVYLPVSLNFMMFFIGIFMFLWD